MIDVYHAMACQKAALDTGFTVELGGEPMGFRAPVAEGTIWLTGAAGLFSLRLDHLAAAEAIGAKGGSLTITGAGDLTALLFKLHGLMKTLPFDASAAFDARVAGLPQTTEAERLVVQRIGQDIFRARLVSRWGPACPMTGITDSALLRASHIKAWADCTTTAERLDPENGILLSALWDAAFDRGLVGYSAQGQVLYANALTKSARLALEARITEARALPMSEGRALYLAQHRTKWGLD
ncbi:HNH endonuclease [Rhodobacter sp. KR11]|uniref:HNH endonuclease n=1 Tax=Rhodobacter sp. KR11 TaxID=2974588 RepID=UPI0022234C43|nr:HNH endonuclease signature motif containing protein [Rhodobacter sp. KR11]MCW1919227.1 HNH endonuclease [Rhodobacter sp. KR11]